MSRLDKNTGGLELEYTHLVVAGSRGLTRARRGLRRSTQFFMIAVYFRWIEDVKRKKSCQNLEELYFLLQSSVKFEIGHTFKNLDIPE